MLLKYAQLGVYNMAIKIIFFSVLKTRKKRSFHNDCAKSFLVNKMRRRHS